MKRQIVLMIRTARIALIGGVVALSASALTGCGSAVKREAAPPVAEPINVDKQFNRLYDRRDRERERERENSSY